MTKLSVFARAKCMFCIFDGHKLSLSLESMYCFSDTSQGSPDIVVDVSDYYRVTGALASEY